MMRLFILLFSVATLFVSKSLQLSTPESNDYVAGVVEMDPFWNMDDNIAKTLASLESFLNIINSPEANELDIIVFPESTLNSRETAEYVPEPGDGIAPCDDDKYDIVMRNISCAAKNRKMYIVINLTEKSDCPNAAMISQNDPRPCSSDNLNKYNANIVFDRNGVVISRYRKFNLFGEAGINTTLVADHSTFATDFNVTFGHFICFDLMFKVPAQELLSQYGVRDIIFPTMWFSELPFLTAAQIQQNWAYENNVNLLAAGASNAVVGSTGTGIYAGKKGPLESVMSYQNVKQLYVARVPKLDRPQPSITRKQTKYTPFQMDDVFLKRDQLDVYETKLLSTTASAQKDTLCHKGLCCTFDIRVTWSNQPNRNFYHYRMAVYQGTRTFDGFADGEVIVCGIIACMDETLASCGVRFNKTTEYDLAANFSYINIWGDFNLYEAFILPNTVDTRIMPLDIEEFTYLERDIYIHDGNSMREIEMELVKPRADLLSFAIYGRRWEKLNGGGRNYVNWIAILTGLIIIKIFF